MSSLFVDGTDFEEIYETTAGPVWIAGMVHIVSEALFLRQVAVYPATSARLNVGVREMLKIFRLIEEAARLQGFVLHSGR